MQDYTAAAFYNTLDIIGIEIFAFLHPKDLFLLGLSNQHLLNEVNSNVIKVCTRHLPLQLGTGTNYLVQISKGLSFPTKQELLDQLLQKVEKAQLLLEGTQTMEESLHRTRALLSGNQSNARFQQCKTLINQHHPPVTVECHYENEIDNVAARFWGKYIIERDSCKNGKANNVQKFKFVEVWLNYILSQRNLVFGKWRWSCKHRDLNFQGVAGVGVMISSSVSGEELEIRLVRQY